MMLYYRERPFFKEIYYKRFSRSRHNLSKMIVYRDLLSEDEMLSDAFKLLPVLDDEKNPVRFFFLMALGF